jgi:hypothetical protein
VVTALRRRLSSESEIGMDIRKVVLTKKKTILKVMKRTRKILREKTK